MGACGDGRPRTSRTLSSPIPARLKQPPRAESRPANDACDRKARQCGRYGPVAKENLRGEACAFYIDLLKQKIVRQ